MPTPPVIDETITPTGTALALVATSSSGTLGLRAFPLDVSCADEGNGRLTAAHASGDTGEVEVLVDDGSAGKLTFGNSLDKDLPAATHSVEVTLDKTPIVDPTDISVGAQKNRLVFVVGNIVGKSVTPVVPLLGELKVSTCEAQTTATTAVTTTTAAPATSVPMGANASNAGANASNAGAAASNLGGAPLSISG